MSPRWEPDPDIRRGRSVVWNLHVHLVFVTRYRRGVFDNGMLTRCEQVTREVCTHFGAEPREFNGEPDHVHLLVHYPPTFALARLVNSLKGVSSRRLRQEYTGQTNHTRTARHLWAPSYSAATCGEAPLEIIKEYIHEQKRPN